MQLKPFLQQLHDCHFCLILYLSLPDAVKSSPVMKLCDWCRNRLMRLMPKYYREAYTEDSRSFQSTYDAARSGCQICSILCAGFTTIFGELESKSRDILTTLVPSLDARTFTVSIRHSVLDASHFEFCSPSGKI